VHDDQRPSLSFLDGAGFVRIRCYAGAGCPFPDILAALTRITGRTFTTSDLRHDTGRNGRDSRGPADRRIVAVYPYHDEAGTLLFETVRYAPKDFSGREGSIPRW
jgi:hypothetical protein